MEAIQKVALVVGIKGLDADYTEFRKLEGDLLIKNGFFNADRLILESEAFDIDAKGKMDFAGDMNFSLKTILSEALTKQLGDSKEVSYFINKEGRAVIPLSMKGPVSSPSFGLDKSLLKDSVKDKIKDEIKDKLFKKLFK